MKLIIGFSNSNKWLSRIISFLTDSKVSHCYVRTKINNVDVVFQASGLLVNIESWELFKAQHQIVEEYETEVETDTALPFILGEMGKPYAIMELIGYLWIILCRQFGFNVSNPCGEGNQAYICSEFVCKTMGINDDLENVTPEDLRKLCSTTYKRIT